MIRELRTFIAVVEHGSFSAAGNKIGLSPSAVMAHIERLEDALGKQLFDRMGNGRPAALNPVGMETLTGAREVLTLWHQMRTRNFSHIRIGYSH